GRLHRVALTTPATYTLADRTAQAAWTTGVSRPFEREYVRKDGSLVSALVGIALLQRNPVQFVNFVLDLTERKQLEQALAERVAQREAIRGAGPEPLAVYDTGGRVVLANAAYKALVSRLIPQAPPGETISQRAAQVGGVFSVDGVPLQDTELAQT